MTSFEEIRHRVDQRLEELREESARLRAAREALRGDGPQVSRGGVYPGRTAEPVVKSVSRDRPTKPTRGSVLTPAETSPVNGSGDTRDPQVERAVRQLRQELAAGLRNG